MGDEEGKTVFVGRLSYNATEDDLWKIFGKFGNVTKLNIAIDRDSNRSRGFAFVTYESVDEVNEAIKEMDGQDIDGRPVNCSVSKPRGSGGSGRGAYGGNRGGNRGGGF